MLHGELTGMDNDNVYSVKPSSHLISYDKEPIITKPWLYCRRDHCTMNQLTWNGLEVYLRMDIQRLSEQRMIHPIMPGVLWYCSSALQSLSPPKSNNLQWLNCCFCLAIALNSQLLGGELQATIWPRHCCSTKPLCQNIVCTKHWSGCNVVWCTADPIYWGLLIRDYGIINRRFVTTHIIFSYLYYLIIGHANALFHFIISTEQIAQLMCAEKIRNL